MQRIWRDAPVLTSGLVLSLLLALFFAGRFALDAIYWADPQHQDQTIAPWMTPRYVAMSWDVPREVVISALGVKQDGHGPEPLRRMAEERGVPVEDLIDALERVIAAHRAGPDVVASPNEGRADE